MICKAIKAFEDNYIWSLQTEPAAESFLCIDPGQAQPVIDFAIAHGLELSHILVTHKHPDHIGGILELQREFPRLQILAPELCYLSYASQALKDGDRFSIAGLDFEFWSTPGHTKDHGIYWLDKPKMLFCGDTLFSFGCGRIFDGSMETLHQSLLRIKQRLQESDWAIFPTHEYTLANLGFVESISGQNLRLQQLKQELMDSWSAVSGSLPSRSQRELLGNPFLTDDYETFKTLRLMRNQWRAVK